MGFDVANVASAQSLAMTGALLVVALLVKLVPGLLLRFLGSRGARAPPPGCCWPRACHSSSPPRPSGLSTAWSTEEFKDAVVLLAVCTCLLGPSLFKAAMPAARPGAGEG